MTRRLRRCNIAMEAIGDYGLSINTSGSPFIVAKKVSNEMALKVLALESRPLFLNDDPLYFLALVKLKSIAANPELARAFRGHTKRWKDSAFGGVMMITIGKHKLDVANVLSAWFNSELFHTGPMKADELSLATLIEKVGGEAEAQTFLAMHLASSLQGWLTSFMKQQQDDANSSLSPKP